MRKFRHKLLTFSITVFLLFHITSCDTSTQHYIIQNNERSEQQQKVTLRFISSWGGYDSKAEPLQQVLDQFMQKHPNIVVINESISGEDFLPKIKTDFASGNDPDVFGLWPGSDIRALIKANKVADLTELLTEGTEWKKSFRSDVWDYTTFDNKIYGLPFEIIYECMFINRDLFEKYDVQIPNNFEELLTAVRKFRNHGIIPIAYNSSSEGTYIYQNIVMKLGGKQEVENPFRDGTVAESYIKAMEYVKKLYQEGAFPYNAFTINDKTRDDLFVNKEAAMIVQGSWFIGEPKLNPESETVEMIPFPYINNGKAHPTGLIYGLGCGNFHMSRITWNSQQKRAAAVKLLQALTSQESAKQFAEKTGMISAVRINHEEIYYSRLMQMGKNLLDSAQELAGPPDSFVDRSAWDQIVVEQFPFVLEGKKEARQVFEEVLRAIVQENSGS